MTLAGLAWFQGAAVQAEAGYPIAGTQPSERPAGAPTVTEVQRPKGWYARALTGISQPYPPSLRFLEDQGDWYTPFIRPGMHGRYDIRGWYTR
jgi:hypothetical protein